MNNLNDMHHKVTIVHFSFSLLRALGNTCFSALLLLLSLPQSPWWKSKLTTFIPTPYIQVTSIWRLDSLSDTPSSLCRQLATSQLPVSCLVWKSLAADADRVPPSCSHAAHGHPPEGLHGSGLLLGGEASVTQLTMTVGRRDQQSENVNTQLDTDRSVFVQSTCPVPRCTPLQRHWAARRARHSMPDSWLSDVVIRADRMVVLWRCNLPGPGADSGGDLGPENMRSHTSTSSNMKLIWKLI